ncbi:MAG: GNAT family N-acetyltransferase [Ruminococcus sp.]|jgi:RimJ/RimL family protein N-acetyltransferase|nr:GNAT family N-acetyltransferase [Ruminococcus sp.]
MKIDRIKTPRLTLRRFSADDWRDLYEYLSQEEIVKYEPYGVYTEEAAKVEAVRLIGNRDYTGILERVESYINKI